MINKKHLQQCAIWSMDNSWCQSPWLGLSVYRFTSWTYNKYTV